MYVQTFEYKFPDISISIMLLDSFNNLFSNILKFTSSLDEIAGSLD